MNNNPMNNNPINNPINNLINNPINNPINKIQLEDAKHEKTKNNNKTIRIQ